MKKALLLLAFLFTDPEFVSADFVIVQKVDGGREAGSMTIKIKDGKMRADMTSHVSTITDSATGDVLTLMHPQKSYMRIPAAQAKALSDRMKTIAGAAKGEAAPPKLTATGRVEKVDQYQTEVYTWGTDAMTVTYWIAKDFPNAEKVQQALAKLQETGMTRGIMPNAAEFPGLAVKTEVKLNDQKVTTTIVSVKEEELDPSIFEAPEEYKEMAAPAFNLPASEATTAPK